jgi:hypothetical protein
MDHFKKTSQQRCWRLLQQSDYLIRRVLHKAPQLKNALLNHKWRQPVQHSLVTGAQKLRQWLHHLLYIARSYLR